jgi:hypothetical protein
VIGNHARMNPEYVLTEIAHGGYLS